MRVLVVRPMEAPCVSEIGSSLEDLQNAVGGWIEAIYPFDDDAAVILNEEGKLNGLDLNRAMRDGSGAIYDVIAGTFLVAGTSGDGFGSLSQRQVETYAELYRNPEVFLTRNGKVKAIPVSPIHAEPIVRNVYEETRNGVRLQIRKDPDPMDPRGLAGSFGKMVLFSGSAPGEAHAYPNPEVFLLDRLSEHFGSVEKADRYIRSLTCPDGPEGNGPSGKPEFMEEAVLNELRDDHVFVPVYCTPDGEGVFTEPSRSWEGSKKAGWIYARKEEVILRFGDFSLDSVRQAEALLREEAGVYADYLKGENYVYDLIDEKSGKVIDGGYWTGDISSLKEFAYRSFPQKEQIRERGPER